MPEASSPSQDSSQFRDGRLPVGNMGKHRRTHHHVERTVGEGQSKRIAFAELYAISQPRPLGEPAGDGEQLGTRIEPDREPALADPPGDVASDGAAATADVKDALPIGYVEQGEIRLARRDFVFSLGSTLEARGEITRAFGVCHRGITPHTLVSVFAHALIRCRPGRRCTIKLQPPDA